MARLEPAGVTGIIVNCTTGLLSPLDTELKIRHNNHMTYPVAIVVPSSEPKTTNVVKLMQVLADGEWHTNWELVEKVGHRFHANVLTLRRGEGPDGEHWRIEGEKVETAKPGEWRYRHVGYAGGYRTKVPRCPKCNTKMVINDIRKSGTGGEYVGAETTLPQSTLLEQAETKLEKMQSTLDWQAEIIKSQQRELERLRIKETREILGDRWRLDKNPGV